jgi:uncharacterized phage protein (TIGR02220 family)
MENLIIPKKFFKAIRKENNKTQILWMRWFFYGEELKNPEFARRFIIDTPNLDPQEIKNIYEWGIKILEDSHFFSQNTDQVQNLEPKIAELEQKTELIQKRLQELEEKLENSKPKTRKSSLQSNSQAVSEVISYLNSVMGTEFRPETPKNAQVISARIGEGFTIDQLKQVIDKKVAEWKGGKMEKYIRPITLFSSDKFESYVNEPIQTQKNSNQTNLFNYATAINEAKKHFGSGSNE